jgi:hypothetical protein
VSGALDGPGNTIDGVEPWLLPADEHELGSLWSPPRGRRRGVVLVLAAVAFVIGLLSLQFATDERAATTAVAPAEPARPGTSVAEDAVASTTSTTTTTIAPLLLDVPLPATRVLGRAPRVAFFGDSIAVEARDHADRLFKERGIESTFDGFGGTATCDYLDSMRRAVGTKPDVVVILFTGNALTPCISSRSGGERGIIEGDGGSLDLLGYAGAYEGDTVAAIETFGPDVDVVLVGVPPTRDGLRPAALVVDELYRRLAADRPNVHYLSTDRLLTPDHTFHDVLPCTLIEPCVPGELVPVRDPDGGHLCAPAPQFCFGGFRMAVMIADAVGQLAVP